MTNREMPSSKSSEGEEVINLDQAIEEYVSDLDKFDMNKPDSYPRRIPEGLEDPKDIERFFLEAAAKIENKKKIASVILAYDLPQFLAEGKISLEYFNKINKTLLGMIGEQK